MKICTIIVSYNFAKWIQPCLNSLRESTIATDVMVIDNNSSDETCKIISEMYPEVILIKNIDNLGFGKANNLGFRYAIEKGYDYVFLLNQDAWVAADAIEVLVEAAVANPDYGIVSPIHLNGLGDKLDFGFATYSHLQSKEEAQRVAAPITECQFINAAMWLVPISALKKVGGFAPIFPHYGEDVDYVHRMRHAGYKIGFAKGAYGCHDREYRVVDRPKFFYMEYIYFLSEAVNVHHTFTKYFGYSVLAAIKKSLLCLFSGKVSDSIKYISIACKLLAVMPKVVATRSKSKNEVGAYL